MIHVGLPCVGSFCISFVVLPWSLLLYLWRINTAVDKEKRIVLVLEENQKHLPFKNTMKNQLWL
jgi:hypothetical protein